MRFAALLSPVDAGSTEVSVEVSGPTSGALAMCSAGCRISTIRHLYVMAMRERVAATLEGRDFSVVTLIPRRRSRRSLVSWDWRRQMYLGIPVTVQSIDGPAARLA